MAGRAVSNGRDVLPDVDGHSVIARRYRDIASAILTDQGGLGECSESWQQLIRRFAASAVLAEQLEARLANGEQIDVAQHALLVSSMVRVARQIGVNRIAKNITPSLNEYLTSWRGSGRMRAHAATLTRRQHSIVQEHAELVVPRWRSRLLDAVSDQLTGCVFIDDDLVPP